MKKIFTLFVFILFVMAGKAQNQGPMNFVGEATFGGTFFGATVSQTNPSDTITFQMNSLTDGDISIPALTFNQMGLTIPAFTIHGATFTFDYSTFTAVFTESQTISETITVGDAEKAYTGKINSAKYQRSDNSFNLNITFKYGSMPGEITYVINATYLPPAGIAETAVAAPETPFYDLSGRRISHISRGQLYIQNGRKQLMK